MSWDSATASAPSFSLKLQNCGQAPRWSLCYNSPTTNQEHTSQAEGTKAPELPCARCQEVQLLEEGIQRVSGKKASKTARTVNTVLLTSSLQTP